MNKFLKFIYNFFWFLIIGILFSLLCGVFGIAMCATLIFIPIGIKYFKAIPLFAIPSGKRVIMNFKKTALTAFLNVVYLVFGGFIFPLLIVIFIMALNISVIGIPLAEELGILGQYLIFPFGAEIVEKGAISEDVKDIDDIILINNRIVYYSIKDKEHLKSVLRSRKDELKKAYGKYIDEKSDTLERISKGSDLTISQFQNYYYHPKKAKFIKRLALWFTYVFLILMIVIYFNPDLFKIFEWIIGLIEIEDFEAFPFVVFMIFGASCVGFITKKASKHTPELLNDQQMSSLYKTFKYGEKRTKEFYKLLRDILSEAYGPDYSAEFDFKGLNKKVVIGDYHYDVLDDIKCIYGINDELLDKYTFSPIHNVVVYEGKNEVLNFAWDKVITEVINEETIVEASTTHSGTDSVVKDNRVHLDTERFIDTRGDSDSSTESTSKTNTFQRKSNNFNSFNKNDFKK